MSNIPIECFRPGFEPKYISIQWSTLFECVDFIIQNIQSFQKSGCWNVQKALKRIEENIGWQNLKKMLKIMVIFIENVEQNMVNISDIVPIFLEA